MFHNEVLPFLYFIVFVTCSVALKPFLMCLVIPMEFCMLFWYIVIQSFYFELILLDKLLVFNLNDDSYYWIINIVGVIEFFIKILYNLFVFFDLGIVVYDALILEEVLASIEILVPNIEIFLSYLDNWCSWITINALSLLYGWWWIFIVDSEIFVLILTELRGNSCW